MAEKSPSLPSLASARKHHRELAYRCSDGMAVALLWDPATDDLLVCGFDERSGAFFEGPVDRERALEAYYHPYAFVGGASINFRNDQRPQ